MTQILQSVYKLAYEISPIILQNGLASAMGGLLPIIAITEAANFTASLLHGKNPLNLDNFFGHFRPLPGSTLIDNEIGEYPFANQAYAANAIIAKPLKISMLMNCPANVNGGYISKMITFTALKAALDSHIQKGGTFVVATPSYIYLNCLLESLVDVSRPDSQQPQNAWQFQFTQPLISQGPQNTLSSLMNSLESGLPTSGDISGPGAVTGSNANVVSGPTFGGDGITGMNTSTGFNTSLGG